MTATAIRQLPRAYWAYLALQVAFFAVAAIPTGTSVWVSPTRAIVGLALLLGLTFQSRLCRLALILLAIWEGLALIVIQADFPTTRDLILIALSLVQVTVLSRKSMRLYTAKR